jgi:hypothetical protein
LTAFLAEHPRYKAALHRSPHAAACTTADLVYEVANVRNTPVWRRAARQVAGAGRAAGGTVGRVVRSAPAAARFARRAGAELAEIGFEKAPSWLETTQAAVRGQILNALFAQKSDAT